MKDALIDMSLEILRPATGFWCLPNELKLSIFENVRRRAVILLNSDSS
jgi:hypothetical protein